MQKMVIVGTCAFDEIESPFGKTGKILGGAGTFIGLAASNFEVDQAIVSVVGSDFPQEYIDLLKDRGINMKGLEVVEDGKTFFWKGRYHNDLNSRDTLITELNTLADFNPVVPWSQKIFDINKDHENLILGVNLETSHTNLFLKNISFPPFAFKSHSIATQLQVERSNDKGQLTVQVQAVLNQKILASKDVHFQNGQKDAWVDLSIPPVAQGKHLVKIQVLPVAGETDIWDNQVFRSVEVLSDTIGILHLLGGPSWDGRFLRRYIKSEPKY